MAIVERLETSDEKSADLLLAHVNRFRREYADL
jgi:hypothetical protein